jgi:Glycosyl transferase family 2
LNEDHEIPEATADSLVESCVRYLNRRGELRYAVNDYISEVFVHKNIGGVKREAQYLSFNFNAPGYEELRIRAGDWEVQHVPGLHNGDQIATQLHQVLPPEKRGASFYYTVSIIVPALNEEKTIAGVLRELQQVDLATWGLSAEVVVADGGSTDRTRDRAREVLGVRVFELPAGSFGKGAAIKHALSGTISDLVVVFPADAEYEAGDLRRLLRPLLAGDCEVALGARNLKPHSDRNSLKKIYGRRYWLYCTSLIGGRILSLLTLVLYSRFISDPLTSARAFLGGKIRRLDWRANGFDHDQEVLGVLLREDSTIFEIPVAYRPRTRAEGKKIRLSDGLAALRTLIRTRFCRLPQEQ